MVERDPERLPEKEDAEEEGPESAPNERDEEVLPEVPRPVFPPSKQPEAIDHPDEPVAGVAHHEAEEDRECEREDKGRVDLAVIRRRKELHEHLEWSEGLHPLFDVLEARLPAFSLREQVREDLPRIAVAFRDGNAREAVLRQEIAYGRGLRFRREDREEPTCGERLVIRRHGLEAHDFAGDFPDERLERVVPAVIREAKGKLRERPDLVDLAVQVLQERLGLLFRGIFLREVEFKGQDFLAQVASDLLRRHRRRLLELKYRRDGSELDEDLGRLRGGRERSADFEAFLALSMVHDVHQLETVQALDRGFEVLPRSDNQRPRHRNGPRHSGHP